MQTTFYGTKRDIMHVWQWLLEMPDMRVGEVYSRPDRSTRWFNSWDELKAAPDAFEQQLGAWSPAFGPPPVAIPITFVAATQKELAAKGRTRLSSPALIKVSSNSDQNGCLATSQITSWSESGARRGSESTDVILDSVDWKKVSSASTAIARRMRKEAPAKLHSYPIMPHAWSMLVDGQIRLWNGSEHTDKSEAISR